jgi:hypothetical protein
MTVRRRSCDHGNRPSGADPASAPTTATAPLQPALPRGSSADVACFACAGQDTVATLRVQDRHVAASFDRLAGDTG